MKRKLSSLKLGFVAFLLLPLTIFVNGFIYGTPSLATESGMTLYFGNHKYTYLAHPKYDLDVFLTKQGHMELNPEVKVSAPDPGNSNQYTKMALDSIQENPREFVLSTMQKIESYVVGIQKIPNLSGEYYLSQDAKSIIIGEERLKWILIIPHLFYELYRLLLLFFLFFAIGYLVFIHKKERIDSRVHKKMFIFLIPWLLGIIPGMLFFTETRYKIVSEILLIPFIMLVLELVLSGSKHSRIEGIDKSFTRPNL
jgi:hypothetical protein